MSEADGHTLGFYENRGDLELGRGNVISTGDLANWPGSYPVYSSSAVGEGVFGRYGRHMFDEELITWSIDGGGRPFHRRKHRFSVTNVCGFLRVKRADRWDYGYLHAILEKQQSGIQFDYQMKAHPSVIRDLYRFDCIPIEAQRRIAAVRDTLDTTIRQTEVLIEKLKQVKHGLLHDLLTRGIDANGELRPPQCQAPHLYKDSPLGWIPREWDALPFSRLADFVNGNSFDAGRWSQRGLPIIRIQNLNGSREFNFYEGVVNPKWHVRPGDLLFAWSGQRGVSFGPRIWSGPQGVLNQHIFKVVERSAIVTKRYLFEVLRFRQGVIEDSAHGFKDSFLHVTRGELGGVVAGIPASEEQQAIVCRIEAFEQRLAAEQSTLEKQISVKAGLMDDLLTGRVRVTPLLA